MVPQHTAALEANFDDGRRALSDEYALADV
jgi:hypothetical protein